MTEKLWVTVDDHKKELESVLRVLPATHRIAFAASCADSLRLEYESFAKESRWGQPAILERGRALAWESIRQSVSRDRINEMIALCERITPDTDELQTPNVSGALDAVTSTVEALRTCLSGSVGDAMGAALAAIDTAWMSAGERNGIDPNDADASEKIESDALVQRELRRQREVLQVLRGLRDLDEKAIQEIRQTNNG